MENSKIEIFSPRFDGERFREHRLPLDLLEDLTALQEMTIEMAKFIYLEKHRNYLDTIHTYHTELQLITLHKRSGSLNAY